MSKENNTAAMAAPVDGKTPVLIRSNNSGVHFGLLAKEDYTPSGKVVTLHDTRRVWYWDGANSLSQMAVEGVKLPGNCKITVAIPVNEIVDVLETMPLTQAAFDNLNAVPVWAHQ